MRVFRIVAVFALWIALGFPAMGQENQGYVLRVEGRLVFIDKGTQDSVRPDDLYQVVRQETIIHPVTGENLGGQIPLGVVRVIEVFPRLSTAEMIELAPGTDPEMLDKEARQGLIRIRTLPEEMEVTARERIMAAESGPAAAGGGGKGSNPDGPIGRLVPGFRLGLGSRPALPVPDRAYKLISDTLHFGALGSPFVATEAYASLADSLVRNLADTTANQALPGVGSSLGVDLSLLLPVSPKVSAIANVGLGGRSLISAGMRFYPGPVLGFLGTGHTPDGRVGEPVVTLKVGWGGQGAQTLPAAADTQFVALSGLTADAAFTATLPEDQKAEADLHYRDGITGVLRQAAADTLPHSQALRQAAVDSVERISKRGMGIAFGLSLPLSRHLSLGAGLVRFGNIREFSGGLTYYMKAVQPDAAGTNPDGALRSLIVGLEGVYDTGLKQSLLDLNLKYPLSHRYTAAARILSDLGDFNRFGISLKGYMN